MPTFGQVVVWVVIGVIGGSLAGALITGSKAGLGQWQNLAVGLAGALIGGFLFRMLGLFPELDTYSVSMRDIVAAIVGSLIVLAAWWALNRSKT